VHSARELQSSFFEIELAGRHAVLGELFEGFGEHDRLGLVMSRPCGAVGASALISATITAFYDVQRARGPEFFIYPDYYLFHVGRPLGDHARLDVWPRRKEVVVGEDPQEILEAIDDRAITRLLVEDGPPGEPSLEREALASARARIATCLAYSPTGRVHDADVRIASNPVTEGYVEAILDRAGGVEPEVRRKIKLARRELVQDGVPVETYRRVDLDEALALLAGSAFAAQLRP
jgi:hypothetical protein